MSNILGPVATIIGALIGAAITYVYGVKRKRLHFWIATTENLTRSLQRHHQQIVVSVGGQPFLDLNRAVVLIKNAGNVSIGDFDFEIVILGQHQGYLHDIIAESADLRSGISVTTDQPLRTYNPVLRVAVTNFLNPSESFRIAIFFDGAADACIVRCRIVDLKVRIRTGAPRDWREVYKEEGWIGVVGPVFGATFAALVLVGLMAQAAEWITGFIWKMH